MVSSPQPGGSGDPHSGYCIGFTLVVLALCLLQTDRRRSCRAAPGMIFDVLITDRFGPAAVRATITAAWEFAVVVSQRFNATPRVGLSVDAPT